jgi:hypothetical protein
MFAAGASTDGAVPGTAGAVPVWARAGAAANADTARAVKTKLLRIKVSIEGCLKIGAGGPVGRGTGSDPPLNDRTGDTDPKKMLS